MMFAPTRLAFRHPPLFGSVVCVLSGSGVHDHHPLNDDAKLGVKNAICKDF